MLQKTEAHKLGRRIVSRINSLSKRTGLITNAGCSDGYLTNASDDQRAYHIHVYVQGGTLKNAPAVAQYIEDNAEHVKLCNPYGPCNYGTLEIPYVPDAAKTWVTDAQDLLVEIGELTDKINPMTDDENFPAMATTYLKFARTNLAKAIGTME